MLAWAPFDRSEYRVVMRGDAAMAFAWDADAIGAKLLAAGAAADASIVPEGLLQAPPTRDGLRVVRCLDGVEAQAWRQQVLVASRWWPGAVSDEEARTWLLAQGDDAFGHDALPSAIAPSWRQQPWAEPSSLDDLLGSSSRLERMAVGCVFAGLAAWTGLAAHQAHDAHRGRQTEQREFERARLEAAPVLAARERAESMARELNGLAEQLSGVMPLELLQHLSDVLPPTGVTVKEFELSGAKLRLGFDLAPEVRRSALVKDLQTGGWLTKVVEVRDASNRTWVPFEAELAGTRAPALPPRAAAPVAAVPAPRLPPPAATAPPPAAATAPAVETEATAPPAGNSIGRRSRRPASSP
jgi:hypothetical protein